LCRKEKEYRTAKRATQDARFVVPVEPAWMQEEIDEMLHCGVPMIWIELSESEDCRKERV